MNARFLIRLSMIMSPNFGLHQVRQSFASFSHERIFNLLRHTSDRRRINIPLPLDIMGLEYSDQFSFLWKPTIQRPTKMNFGHWCFCRDTRPLICYTAYLVSLRFPNKLMDLRHCGQVPKNRTSSLLVVRRDPFARILSRLRFVFLEFALKRFFRL